MSLQLYNIYLKSNAYVTALGNFDPAARPEIQIFDLQNRRKWPMNFSSGTEKKYAFFFPLRGNTIFGYEWINDQRTFPCKKKYGNFETDFIIIDPKFCAWK